MVGPWPLAPHHDYLQYIHRIHLMQRGQNQGVTLWALLSVAKDFGLPNLYVFGDSSVIINWVNGDSSLNMVNLDAWCYNTKLLLSTFTHVDISHVYREYNTRADTLSKEGLMEDVGYLTLSQICDGEALEEVRMQLF